MDITFSCQNCGQHMIIDQAGAGLVIQCPKCRRDVTVPKAAETKTGPTTQPPAESQPQKERTVALHWTPPGGIREPPRK
jgi:DNA-directed RNA polymerase subunit M/transcription elongation factor TFIIS